MSQPAFRSGIFLPPHHPNEEDVTLCLQRDMRLVEWLDELGFEEAWFGEHHSGGFEVISSPELMIASIARSTKRIKLGTGVISLSYHNPLTVAGRIVQLDHMTRGRVMFGAGPGALVHDALLQGIDPKKTRERLAESLDVILRLFRGETVTKETSWFTLKDAYLHILPFSQPHPEVVVASTNTPSGGRLAGKHGAGLICVTASAQEGYDALATNWKLANEVAAQNGKVMDRDKLRLVAPIHLAETREQARKDVEFGLRNWVEYHWYNGSGTKQRYIDALNQGQELPDVVTGIRGGVIGTPDDAIALIDRLRERQGHFGCFLHWGHNWADFEKTKKSFELYARYVVPHFRNSNVKRFQSYQYSVENIETLSTAMKDAIADQFAKHNALSSKKDKEPTDPAS